MNFGFSGVHSCSTLKLILYVTGKIFKYSNWYNYMEKLKHITRMGLCLFTVPKSEAHYYCTMG
jgi:hypothetical protein